MRHALSLARQGRTHPNPHVGAVVVRDGIIVGRGFHPRKGEPHAEAFAFEEAGEAAHGATLYVTLEPCSHTDGGRIPCVARCLAAGVARVVVAMVDPDTRVSGRGITQLRAAGIQVTVGVGEQAARLLNLPYIKHRTTGLPYILQKAAMTLDGKIAAPGGDSKWITGTYARSYVHRLRNKVDAIVAGIGTVLADDPELTTRLPHGNGHNPQRVIIDSNLRLPTTAKVARAGTIVIATERADANRRQEIEATGVEVVLLPADSEGRVSVVAVAHFLAERGLLFVLLEGGGTLAASFWSQELIDKVLYFVAPKIIGGSNAQTPVGGIGLSQSMAAAVPLKRFKIRRFGADIALEAEVRRNVYRDN